MCYCGSGLSLKAAAFSHWDRLRAPEMVWKKHLMKRKSQGRGCPQLEAGPYKYDKENAGYDRGAGSNLYTLYLT